VWRRLSASTLSACPAGGLALATLDCDLSLAPCATAGTATTQRRWLLTHTHTHTQKQRATSPRTLHILLLQTMASPLLQT
jgi:hypothetical protein